MLSNIYFMHLADNLQARIVEKINKSGFRLYGNLRFIGLKPVTVRSDQRVFCVGWIFRI